MQNNDKTVKNKSIYLIDTDMFFSLGLGSQLEQKGFDVCCSNLEGEALAADVAVRKPDILLLGNDKILSVNRSLISNMKTISPASVSILLSSLVNAETCFTSYRKLGLSSCISKKHEFDCIYNVIRVVSRGYCCFPFNSNNQKIKTIESEVSELELTILKSILQGNNNDCVAKELSVPIKRVSSLKIGLMKRFGVNSTAHLVIKAQHLLVA